MNQDQAQQKYIELVCAHIDGLKKNGVHWTTTLQIAKAVGNVEIHKVAWPIARETTTVGNTLNSYYRDKVYVARDINTGITEKADGQAAKIYLDTNSTLPSNYIYVPRNIDAGSRIQSYMRRITGVTPMSAQLTPKNSKSFKKVAKPVESKPVVEVLKEEIKPEPVQEALTLVESPMKSSETINYKDLSNKLARIVRKQNEQYVEMMNIIDSLTS